MKSGRISVLGIGISYDTVDEIPGRLKYYKRIGYNEAYAGGVWIDDSYKTINLSTAQTVSKDFYNWAITGGNLVKQ